MASTHAYAEASSTAVRSTIAATRYAALGAALLALACILGLLEASLPSVAPVPWLRLGLANIAVVVALVVGGGRMAAIVSTGRVVIVGLATGTLAGPAGAMALAGAAASLAVMWALWRAELGLSPIGWSAAGSVAHVTAQFAVAAVLLGSGALVTLAVPSLLVALLLGALVGSVASVVVSRLPRQ
jgi:heptaprenyl diphosphate synthase